MTGRTSRATRRDAEALVDRARVLLMAADLLVDEDDPAARSAAAAVSVLAGIAAADAICAVRLARRSRGQDHKQATALLDEATPRGSRLPADLDFLLDIKDQAHYGVRMVNREHATGAVRRARTLYDGAREALAS